MRAFFVGLIVAVTIAGGTLYQLVSRAEAQAAATTAAQLDAGPGPVITGKTLETGQPLPAPAVAPQTIPDPVSSPGDAFNELRAARAVGWPVFVLVVLDMLLVGVGHLGLSWLKQGHRALYLAAATTGIGAAALAALGKASWIAVGTAAAAAAWGYWRTHQGVTSAQAVA